MLADGEGLVVDLPSCWRGSCRTSETEAQTAPLSVGKKQTQVHVDRAVGCMCRGGRPPRARTTIELRVLHPRHRRQM